VLGILMNLIFLVFEPPERAAAMEMGTASD